MSSMFIALYMFHKYLIALHKIHKYKLKCFIALHMIHKYKLKCFIALHSMHKYHKLSELISDYSANYFSSAVLTIWIK